MIGTCKLVLGIHSDTISRKTVKASNTDIPHEIFSPACKVNNMSRSFKVIYAQVNHFLTQ